MTLWGCFQEIKHDFLAMWSQMGINWWRAIVLLNYIIFHSNIREMVCFIVILHLPDSANVKHILMACRIPYPTPHSNHKSNIFIGIYGPPALSMDILSHNDSIHMWHHIRIGWYIILMSVHIDTSLSDDYHVLTVRYYFTQCTYAMSYNRVCWYDNETVEIYILIRTPIIWCTTFAFDDISSSFQLPSTIMVPLLLVWYMMNINVYVCLLHDISRIYDDIITTRGSNRPGKLGGLAWKQSGMWENINEFQKNRRRKYPQYTSEWGCVIMRKSNRLFIPVNDYSEFISLWSFAEMNGQLELHIITHTYSAVYLGYFRRLVFGNLLTKRSSCIDFCPPDFHIPPCFPANPPDFPRLIGPRVLDMH